MCHPTAYVSPHCVCVIAYLVLIANVIASFPVFLSCHSCGLKYKLKRLWAQIPSFLRETLCSLASFRPFLLPLFSKDGCCGRGSGSTSFGPYV